MEIQITATPQIVTIDGVECRLWEGVTARGVKCKVFVHRVAVLDDGESTMQFEQELRECLPPGRPAIDLRHIL